jgi:hypothetical protein
MELQAFLDGYNVDAHTPPGRLLHERYEEAHNLAEELERRSAFFGGIITEVVDLASSLADIEGREEKLSTVPDEKFTEYEALFDQMHDYFSWYVDVLPKGTKKVPEWRNSGDAFLSTYANTISSHIQIHDLNASFESYWYHFLAEGSLGQKPSKREQKTAIESLTLTAAGLIQFREKTLLKNGTTKTEYVKGTNSVFKAGDVEGFLNEIEAAIALLHVSMEDTGGGWWVLPAPAQFEYMAGKNNNDFLLIDTANSRGVGIQVKSSGMVEANGVAPANDRVIQISGRHDLGNVLNIKRPDVLGHDTYSYAGGLALSVLAGINGRGRKNLLNSDYRMAYLMAARAKPKTLQHAVGRVKYKVDSKL